MPAHLEPDPDVPESITTLVPPYWTDKKGVAHAFMVSTRTVDNWRERGWIPAFVIGGTIRFDLEAVKISLEHRFKVHPKAAEKAIARAKRAA